MSYDYEGEMEKAKLRAKWSKQPDAPIRHVWIVTKGFSGFEEAAPDTIIGLTNPDDSMTWVGRVTARKLEDIFDTELDARNELERRLYKRLLDLQKHREAMTKLLISCAFPVTSEVKS